MDNQEIIVELNTFRERLTREVVSAYEQRGSSFGNNRFAAWRKKFTHFLNENLPGEVSTLDNKLSHFGSVIIRGETDVERFLREDGETMVSYIDSLILDVENGECNMFLEEKAEQHQLKSDGERCEVSFEELLHPVIYEHSYRQYKSGHLRDAVLNAFVAVFDLIRDRTGIDLDGTKLTGQVFSLKDPKLIFSNISSDSGRNDQTGFLQIFQGAYIGIRNPKAHTLRHDLTEEKTAQYLVFASLLARRVEEADIP